MYDSSFNNIYSNTFVGDGIVFQSQNSQNVIGSNYNNVTNNNLTNSSDFSIIFYNGSHNTVADNYIAFNRVGIEEASTVFNGNLIYDNQIINNSVGIANGMLTNREQSLGNEIIGNNITGSDRGLWLDSDHSVITDNNITGNEVAIYMEGSQDNTIDRNIIQGTVNAVALGPRNNYQVAIQPLTNPTRIYLNNITGSVDFSDPYIPYCKWDNGTVGNYWSDYQSKYPNASEVGNLGIWDTPYLLNANNLDNYPLVNQVDINAPAPTPTPIPTLSPSELPTSLPPSPSVPEFPTWVVPSIFLLTALAVVVAVEAKRKH